MCGKKKIMLLGGLRYLLPVINEAHKLNCHVITADYLPNNIAHKYSDEYCNVSIIDKEAVLEAAQSLKIDGILSFAVDPGVVSAAYVAEKMGLDFQCSYKSACILQDKSLFRNFLSENGFNCPHAHGFYSFNEAINNIKDFSWPIIVKPVDSAGSKGVSRVDDLCQLQLAVDYALSESHSGKFIIEDFIEKKGYSFGSESFVLNGKLVYNGFYDQYFDNEALNPYTPSAEVWPSILSESNKEYLKNELQRLFSLLEVRTGLFNVEGRIAKDGKIYIMEVSPRAGGNRLAEMLNYAADVNIIEAEVKKSIGLPVDNIHEPIYKGHFAVFVLHSSKEGTLNGIFIPNEFKEKYIIEEEIRVNIGDKVSSFSGANAALGTLLMKFDNREELDEILHDQKKWITIDVQS